MDEHVGLATAGLLADGKHLGSRLREEAYNFRDTYNAPATVQVTMKPEEAADDRFFQIVYQDMSKPTPVTVLLGHLERQVW